MYATSLLHYPLGHTCCSTILKLTYNKNRHEASTGDWHRGSNDRHPELEKRQKVSLLLSGNSISFSPTLLWIHKEIQSEGFGSSARRWSVKGLWSVKVTWRNSANTSHWCRGHLGDCCGSWITKGMDEHANSFALDLEVEISCCSKQHSFS